MFKRIQQLKIAELKQQIAKIRNQQHILHNPVDELQDQIYALEKLIKRGNSAYQGKQKFNFFEKHFTKRSSYKEYQDWLDRQQALSSQMEKLKARIKVQKEVVDMEREGLQRSIDILNREISKIEQAKSLAELGIEPQAAAEILKQHQKKTKPERRDDETGVLQSGGQKAVQTEKDVKPQREKQEQQTAQAQNPAQSFYINPKRLVEIVKHIRKMSFNAAIEFFNQIKPKLEELVMVGGVNREVDGDVSQIEVFENQIYQAVGLRPMKIDHIASKYAANNTARDIVERIIANVIANDLMQRPLIRVEEKNEEEQKKVKPEGRTL